MRTALLLCLTSIALLLPLGVTQAQPQQWELLQNDPNPFCGATSIRFAVPEVAEVHLTIWNPDSTAVVRSLFQGLANVGMYDILWDQLDEEGVPVSDGDYPYQLFALYPESRVVLFEAWLVASVDCDPTPAERTSWGRIKGRYADRR